MLTGDGALPRDLARLLAEETGLPNAGDRRFVDLRSAGRRHGAQTH